MKTLAIIQARMGSIRLPGKVLLPLAGKPLLWHICNRLSYCKEIDKIIVATSQTKNDDQIENFCKKNNIECYRGSLNNVFKRFINVLNKYKADYVARICADAPFPIPEFIDARIKALKMYDGDIILFKNYYHFLLGQSIHAVRSLRKAYSYSQDKRDLEHVGSFYFAKHLNKLRVVALKLPKKFIVKDCRLLIDTFEDYQFISKIYKDLYQEDKLISIYAIKDWVNKNPKLLEINKNISMKPYFSKFKKIEKDNLKRANIIGTYELKKKDFIK